MGMFWLASNYQHLQMFIGVWEYHFSARSSSASIMRRTCFYLGQTCSLRDKIHSQTTQAFQLSPICTNKDEANTIEDHEQSHSMNT